LLDSLKLLKGQDWAKIEEISIFGGGPLKDQILSSCEVLKRAGHPVTVGGYLDKHEAAKLLAFTDYLLLPSRIESIPVIFSDAMKSRCPIVATPVGDLPRLIEQYQVGHVACEVGAAAFAEAVLSALGRMPRDFDNGLRKAAREFDLVKVVECFLSAVGFPAGNSLSRR
jgi:glycosyltransferase involved in cell wall biosynthesis